MFVVSFILLFVLLLCLLAELRNDDSYSPTLKCLNNSYCGRDLLTLTPLIFETSLIVGNYLFFPFRSFFFRKIVLYELVYVRRSSDNFAAICFRSELFLISNIFFDPKLLMLNSLFYAFFIVVLDLLF